MKTYRFAIYLFLAGILLTGCSAVQAQAAAPAATATETPVPAAATLEFIGHACFLLTASDETRIVIDPYQNYSSVREINLFPEGITADAVVITHFHPDHANFHAISGARVIYQAGTDSVGIVKLTGLAGDHGLANGAPAGANTVWVFEIGSIKILHIGANGVVTEPEILTAMENADAVILRVGGDSAHPVKEMVDQMRQKNVRTIIPSHYRISKEYRFGSP